MPDPTVLLVGRDDMLAGLLEARGFMVTVVETGQDALRMVPALKPDLVVLELVLPDADGLVVLPRIKDLTDAGLIVCSARQTQSDRVVALRTGADDFCPKPVDVDELEQRCRAVLNRVEIARRNVLLPPGPNEPIVLGDLTVLRTHGDGAVRGKRLNLTRTEYLILELLALRAGSVLKRAEISVGVWGHNGYATVPGGRVQHAIDVHIGRLRLKMERAGLSTPAILTARSLGYELHFAQPKEGEPS